MASRQRTVILAALATFLVPASIYGGVELRGLISGKPTGAENSKVVEIQKPPLTEKELEALRKESVALLQESDNIARKLEEITPGKASN